MKLLSVCLTVLMSLPVMAQTYPDYKSFVAAQKKHHSIPASAFVLPPELSKTLKVEVWAASPLVFSPVAMDIDAQGRIWMSEGVDFQTFPPRIRAGRSIIVLSDTDKDGKADKSHVFITENMPQVPFGISVFDNRIVVSATPHLIVYTDVNRNAVFDRGIDKREIFLTGFNGQYQFHILHQVVPSPSGQWYFSYGNLGADVKTKDGRHFMSEG